MSQCRASETRSVTGITDNSAVLLQREEQKTSDERLERPPFVHCCKQFVVLVICKYNLYIYKKYSIDFDFFKCMLFVLCFRPRLSTAESEICETSIHFFLLYAVVQRAHRATWLT